MATKTTTNTAKVVKTIVEAPKIMDVGGGSGGGVPKLDSLVFNNTDLLVQLDDSAKTKTESEVKAAVQGQVLIGTQQRAGKKCMTLIEGLAVDLDQKKILKFMRKLFKTNGTILKDADDNEIIKLQGDFRVQAKEFLTKFNIVEDVNLIKIRGA